MGGCGLEVMLGAWECGFFPIFERCILAYEFPGSFLGFVLPVTGLRRGGVGDGTIYEGKDYIAHGGYMCVMNMIYY